MDQLCWLLARPTKNQCPSRFMKISRYFLKSKQTGCIEGRHVAKTNDHNWRQPMHVLGDQGDLVGGTEQERTVNTENGCVVGDVFVLQDVHSAVFDVVVSHL